MFEKLLSFIYCCLPTITPVRRSSVRRKRHKHQTTFITSCPSSSSCHLSPFILPYSPSMSNSSQHPFYDDSMMTSTDDSSTFVTDDTSCISRPTSNRSTARIAAIRELIQTEQIYVRDLRTIANDFIKPLNNNQVINDYEIENVFCNWFNLIACNTVLLTNLQEQVHYREIPDTSDRHSTIRTLRSASMSNIALSAQAFGEPARNSRHASNISLAPVTPPDPESRYRSRAYTHRRRSPSPEMLTLQRSPGEKQHDYSVVPQSSQMLTSTMSIDESTRIGEILCSYLPYMADAYFQYCNCRPQANKQLQIKIDSNKKFRNYVTLFQNQAGGLSLNGFLTKPVQRVTRYPLLIGQILKNTPIDHPDYQFVQQAQQNAVQLAERINTQMSEQQNRFQLDWLQHHVIFGTDEHAADGYVLDELLKFNAPTKLHRQRQLIINGSIIKVPSGRELAAFLFNDFLMLCTVKSSSSNWEKQLFELKSSLQLKLYRSPYFLSDITAVSETLGDDSSFSIYTNSHPKPLTLRTDPPSVRSLWMRSIDDARKKCKELEMSITNDTALRSATENEQESPPALARLEFTINEAHIGMLSPTRTAASQRHRALNPYCQIKVGSSTSRTPFTKRTNRPKWNHSMQFLLYNLTDDRIQIDIIDHEFFSPDENIDSTSIRLTDILPCPLDVFRDQPTHAFNQTIHLNRGTSISMKCTVNLLPTFQ